MTRDVDPARRTAGVVAALGAVSIWAGWLPVTRLGVVTHLTPGDVAALRFGTSGLVLLPMLLLYLKEVPWRRVVPLAFAATGAGVPYFAVFWLCTLSYGVVMGHSSSTMSIGEIPP